MTSPAARRGLSFPRASYPRPSVVQTEAHFQTNVVQLARIFGWRVYHTYDSRLSEPGFPDLVLLRKNRLIAAELKTETGSLTPKQREWIAAFGDAGVETHIWRPSQMAAIAEALR